MGGLRLETRSSAWSSDVSQPGRHRTPGPLPAQGPCQGHSLLPSHPAWGLQASPPLPPQTERLLKTQDMTVSLLWSAPCRIPSLHRWVDARAGSHAAPSSQGGRCRLVISLGWGRQGDTPTGSNSLASRPMLCWFLIFCPLEVI